jgi:hypothetical protein
MRLGRGTFEWDVSVIPPEIFWVLGSHHAVGFEVFGPRWNFSSTRPRAVPFVGLCGGMLFSPDNFPLGATARFNFTAAFDAGTHLLLRPRHSFDVGMQVQHASNAHLGRLNPRAPLSLQLTFWAQQFPNRLPEHYVFPKEKVGAAGNAFDTKVYGTDPTKPIGDIKEAWEAAKRRTRRHCPQCGDGILTNKPKPAAGYVCDACHWETPELPTGLVAVRFHDLRHTAVSRMIAARTPLPIIAKIVGWSAGTMAKMAARYGHFGIEDLRSAVESISTRENPEIESGYPQFPPQSDARTGLRRAN